MPASFKKSVQNIQPFMSGEGWSRQHHAPFLFERQLHSPRPRSSNPVGGILGKTAQFGFRN